MEKNSKQLRQCRPIVAIIGRPNVGKSSIFNRLAGRRISIVHEESGVTRDRIVCTIRYKDRCFDLVDTGGLENAEAHWADNALPDQSAAHAATSAAPRRTPHEIEAAVHRQVNLALDGAGAVIFAVDARTGVTAADEKAAALLHKSGLPVLLAANKIDSVELESHAHDFDKFGFPVFPVSALNNRGLDDLTDKLDGILPPGTDDDIPRLRIAIVGCPNVGKSLLVNCLTQSERVIVSGEPGTTRDSIDVPLTTKAGNQWEGYILTDTAGLRKTKKIKCAVDSFSQMRTRESINSADVVALVLDATRGPTAYDKTIAAHVLENNKCCVLIVNKWDLVPAGSQQSCRAALYRAMPFMDFVPVVCASAATGFNIRRIIETVNDVAAQNRKKIATGILNRGLEIATARFQSPFVHGGRLKIFYATQTAIQPITFLLFVNDPVKLSLTYEKYLKGALRKAFGFEGAPIVFKYKKRSQKSETGGQNQAGK